MGRASDAPAGNISPNDGEARLDVWLWQARFCKSRSQAAALCRSGLLRRNGQAIAKPGLTISPGDVLSFPYGHTVRVVRVLALARRRGPAAEARLLYCDLTAEAGPATIIPPPAES